MPDDYTVANRYNQMRRFLQRTDTNRKATMTDTSYDAFEESPPEQPVLIPDEVIPGDALVPQRDQFELMLERSRSQAVEDPESVQRAITERILNATNDLDIFTQPEARHARDFLDEPLVFHGVHFNESDFEDGPGFYAVAQVSDPDTGDIFAVTCGGRNVMAQLYAAAARGMFPITLKFTQARKPTRKGYFPLWLVAAP